LSEITNLVAQACARAAHEANRAYCLALGDTSQVAWDSAPDWQRSSCLVGVRGVLAGNGPREGHVSWLAEKERTGWKFGPVKDPAALEHPCMVPYDELPPEQRMKDRIFVDVVLAMALAFGARVRIPSGAPNITVNMTISSNQAPGQIASRVVDELARLKREPPIPG